MSTSEDLSEMDSVEVTEPQETFDKSNTSTGHISSSTGSNVMAFLKRNAFVVLTMAAVALGKWFSNTTIICTIIALLCVWALLYSVF